MSWQTFWSVTSGAVDISEPLRPYLIDISVTDKAGEASDTCAITIDDTGGNVRMPTEKEPLLVSLNGIPVFSGFVDSVRSSGSRFGGRVLRVQAKGFDPGGKAKQSLHFHMDDTTLKAFLTKAAEKAGFTLKIDEDLGATKRSYWAADGESFLHLGQRLAREFFATFKLRGKQAVFLPRGETVQIATVLGEVGEAEPGNVISWEITPVSTRARYGKTKVRWFDRASGTWKTEEVEHGGAGSGDADEEAVETVRTSAHDADQAKAIAKARKRQAKRNDGLGSVEIDVNPLAQAEGLFVLSGARVGVDGTYRIAAVTHQGNRGGGTTTRLELCEPDI
ncbi:tail protein [Hartmannibacter diazotrophicus]|uniref:Tail protein n=1 Tax=Hartmannibacter diazotrophicus TaxID=1482074 RepID=A0A2C9D5M1_9HYPH|nr:late control D family protein [Hartmannibacter diazotrophicus]SON55543.1 tail protein [Hartmannibacter diazotrophicus]